MSPSCKGQQCRMFPVCRHNEDDNAKQTALETHFQKSFVLFASWLSASSKFKPFEQTHIHCFTPCCTCIQQKEKGVKIQLLPWQHLTTGVRRAYCVCYRCFPGAPRPSWQWQRTRIWTPFFHSESRVRLDFVGTSLGLRCSWRGLSLKSWSPRGSDV